TIVAVADLKKGSLLQADYTRKTQEVAEQRRTVETQSSALRQQTEQLEQQRAYAQSLIQSFTPQPPDIALLQTDPVAYMSQKANYEQMAGHLAYLQQQQQRSE